MLKTWSLCHLLVPPMAALSFAELAPTSAQACAPPPCTPAVLIPAELSTVPANAPAFLFKASHNHLSNEAPDASGIKLLNAEGQVVPVDIAAVSPGSRDFLVKPQSALTPGQAYTVKFPDLCTATEKVLNITAGVSAELPTALGTATFAGHRVGTLNVPTSSGSCTANVQAAMAKISLTPTPQLRAYLALSSFRATVAGQTTPLVNHKPPTADGPLEFEVHSTCTTSDSFAAMGLAPGAHTVQLHATLPGASAPTPAVVDVLLTC